MRLNKRIINEIEKNCLKIYLEYFENFELLNYVNFYPTIIFLEKIVLSIIKLTI